MSTNYLTGALFAVLGGVVAVASQSFSPSVLGWVAFGVAIAVATAAVLAQLDRSRGLVQRALDAATVIVAGLLIIFSRTFSGDAVTWLGFAFALGIVALAYAGLTVHEVTERREHIPAPAKADASVIGATQARVA